MSHFVSFSTMTASTNSSRVPFNIPIVAEQHLPPLYLPDPSTMDASSESHAKRPRVLEVPPPPSSVPVHNPPRENDGCTPHQDPPHLKPAPDGGSRDMNCLACVGRHRGHTCGREGMSQQNKVNVLTKCRSSLFFSSTLFLQEKGDGRKAAKVKTRLLPKRWRGKPLKRHSCQPPTSQRVAGSTQVAPW